MSWDSIDSAEKCPCGKGSYTVSHHSNDWGQHRTTWRMDCPLCKRRYALHAFACYPNGLFSEGYRWILKGAYNQAQKLLQRSEVSKKRALGLAREKYLNQFVTRFDGASKRHVWDSLFEAIPNYKILSTFYEHTKGKAPREYLTEEFSHHAIAAVRNILGVQDTEIELLQRGARLLFSRAEKLLSGGTT
jgi:hypothetical protein